MFVAFSTCFCYFLFAFILYSLKVTLLVIIINFDTFPLLHLVHSDFPWSPMYTKRAAGEEIASHVSLRGMRVGPQFHYEFGLPVASSLVCDRRFRWWSGICSGSAHRTRFVKKKSRARIGVVHCLESRECFIVEVLQWLFIRKRFETNEALSTFSFCSSVHMFHRRESCLQTCRTL